MRSLFAKSRQRTDSAVTARAQAEIPSPSEATPFAFNRDLCRLLTTFFAVAVIDLTVGSWLTGKLRLWFPQWLDPDWATASDTWVMYSQSYLAGVFLIPVLARIVDRDCLAHRGWPVRTVFWAACLLALLFIAAWKGELLLVHEKQGEAAVFALLTACIYGLSTAVRAPPAWLANVPPLQLLRRLMLGIAVFFGVMTVLDPVLQLVIQGMAWSRGLTVEIAFFIIAALALVVAARAIPRHPTSA